MKFVYCSDCGTKIPVHRKALPKYSVIIDTVESHICHEEPIEFDLKPQPFTPREPEGKFVKNLNDLNPATVRATFGGVSTEDLRDRRFEPGPKIVDKKTKSTAPLPILDLLNSIQKTESPTIDLAQDKESESED